MFTSNLDQIIARHETYGANKDMPNKLTKVLGEERKTNSLR